MNWFQPILVSLAVVAQIFEPTIRDKAGSNPNLLPLNVRTVESSLLDSILAGARSFQHTLRFTNEGRAPNQRKCQRFGPDLHR